MEGAEETESINGFPCSPAQAWRAGHSLEPPKWARSGLRVADQLLSQTSQDPQPHILPFAGTSLLGIPHTRSSSALRHTPASVSPPPQPHLFITPDPYLTSGCSPLWHAWDSLSKAPFTLGLLHRLLLPDSPALLDSTLTF